MNCKMICIKYKLICITHYRDPIHNRIPQRFKNDIDMLHKHVQDTLHNTKMIRSGSYYNQSASKYMLKPLTRQGLNNTRCSSLV